MPKETFFNLNPEKQDRIMSAVIDEFASHSYNEVKLSRIIKAADIPRGSFYQYFEDKEDLYKYLFQVIGDEKIKYLGSDLLNKDEIPFITLFHTLMESGLRFAIDNPKYIQITRFLTNNRGLDIFNTIIGDGMKLARTYYRSYIETDKKHGRIRDDVDTEMLIDIIIEMTTTLSFMQLTSEGEVDFTQMLQRLDQFLIILQKGIE